MSETRDEELWTPAELPPLGGEEADSIVEIDPYTITLLEQDFQRRQEMEAAEQQLRAAGLTVMEFEEAGEDTVVFINEHRCRDCGCSESRACDGGCVWATPNLCSRCARKEYARGAASG